MNCRHDCATADCLACLWEIRSINGLRTDFLLDRELLHNIWLANVLLRFLPHDRNAWNLEGLLP